MTKLFIPLLCFTTLLGCSTKDTELLQAYQPLTAAELTEEENYELCSDSAYSLCNHLFQLKKLGSLMVDTNQAPAPTIGVDIGSESIMGYAHPYHYTASMIRDGRKVHFNSINFHKVKAIVLLRNFKKSLNKHEVIALKERYFIFIMRKEKKSLNLSIKRPLYLKMNGQDIVALWALRPKKLLKDFRMA